MILISSRPRNIITLLKLFLRTSLTNSETDLFSIISNDISKCFDIVHTWVGPSFLLGGCLVVDFGIGLGGFAEGEAFFVVFVGIK